MLPNAAFATSGPTLGGTLYRICGAGGRPRPRVRRRPFPHVASLITASARRLRSCGDDHRARSPGAAFAHRGAPRPGPTRPIRGSIDRFGRVATDLRISLTDRCNLRCTYCMPAEGLPWMPRAEQLTDDELVRLIAIAVRDLGVHELRFTGGEPLLRRGLEDMIAASAALTPRPDISLTTNGIGLARRAAALAAAGREPAQRLPRHPAPRPLRRDHPPRPARRRPRRHARPPATPACPPSRSTRSCCAA